MSRQSPAFAATQAGIVLLIVAGATGCTPGPDTTGGSAAPTAAAESAGAAQPGLAIDVVPFPGGPGSGQPRLTTGPDGTPLLSWLEPAGDATVLRYARFEDHALGASHDVVSGEHLFVNWADLPSVTPITDELWYAHWLELQPESFGAYDIRTAISHDGGRTWSPTGQLNDDTTEAEHGFVRVFAGRGGIETFWLDGRELANFSFDEPDAFLGTSLRRASVDASGSVTDREIVDDVVCDCCQPDVAMTDAGPIVIFRDRTEGEIRDVKIRRYLDGAWSEPQGLGNEGWHIDGCPVNGPVIAARGQLVAAAWYTAADSKSRVRFARSADAGATFSPAVDVDASGAYGQPALVLDDDGRAVLAWWRRAAGGGIDLVVEALSPDGTTTPIGVVGHDDIGQPVTVTQMVRAGDAYLVAWATFDDDGTIRVVELAL